MRFDKFPGFSWLSEEIFLQTKISMNFPQTLVAPIILVHQNYKQYFAMDTIMSCKLKRESLLFSKVQCKIWRENYSGYENEM